MHRWVLGAHAYSHSIRARSLANRQGRVLRRLEDYWIATSRYDKVDRGPLSDLTLKGFEVCTVPTLLNGRPFHKG